MLPSVVYTLLVVASAMVTSHIDAALFTIAPAVMLLMFIGIHNAWDTATWMAYFARGQPNSSTAAGEASSQSESGT